MESICKIELRGIIGTAAINNIGGTRMARFSLATDYAYKTKEGECVIDTTWFNCTAWQSEKIQNLDQIQKGKVAHLQGRVRMQRYTDAFGVERCIWEVVCQTLEISDR
ncbi:MAG: single-stranded DNA-binding protein [Bacteroidales bacterium]|nr:single-stranded DNA-binding protein [Bacteroidales bacterium]